MNQFVDKIQRFFLGLKDILFGITDFERGVSDLEHQNISRGINEIIKSEEEIKEGIDIIRDDFEK